MTPDFTDFCLRAGLGRPLSPATPVTGGLLHRMFRLTTTRGVWAVKLLRPEVMARPGVMANMQRSEAVARALSAHVPAVAALTVDGSAVLASGAGHCMIFPWQEGASVFPPDLSADHCRCIGDVLGRIHRAGVTVPGLAPDPLPRPPLPWPEGCYEQLRRWDEQVIAAKARLAGTQVISHRDLDPKNVLWQAGRPLIIDWEAAGYVNPWQELVEVLNYWAADDAMARALIAAYARHMPLASADWPAALTASLDSMLGWLHYNQGLARTAPDAAQRAEAARQADAAFAELRRCEARSTRLLPLLTP